MTDIDELILDIKDEFILEREPYIAGFLGLQWIDPKTEKWCCHKHD